MKVSHRWLREWIDPPADLPALAEALTLAGLEVEHEPVVAELPEGVVVGRITAVAPHPNADRLRVCTVDVGDGAPRQIVCGAPNAREGLLAPAALPGARLPGGVRIREARLRGVDSAGMLCSAAELGLGEGGGGLLELDADARPGIDIVELLGLDDHILAFELTPNRGDCLSVLGLAREVAAIHGLVLDEPAMRPVAAQTAASVPVRIEQPEGCSGYAGRVIEGLRADARTPLWMAERLRRSGIRTIHPVVDITNYVMLELGQPMHAFDRERIGDTICVRAARPGERIVLLDGQTLELAGGELLIADAQRPLALAGVMGGQDSAVSGATRAIFLESARFAPECVAATLRRHRLHSDSAHRFERGVDPGLQRRALERATELVLEICGGRAGEAVQVGDGVPPVEIRLRHERIERLLGIRLPQESVPELLGRLRIAVRADGPGVWRCVPPSDRHDLRIEADLIEEIARLHGYHRIEAPAYAAQLAPVPRPEGVLEEHALRDRAIARGFSEIVSYAFVDSRVQHALGMAEGAVALDNPIADNMDAMRTSLLPGLLSAWRHNAQRQASRAALFELGRVFRRGEDGIVESDRLGLLVAGEAFEEQWGEPSRPFDFFDLKGELEALFGGCLQFEPLAMPALHPGQAARILRDGRPVGWIGAVHPQLLAELDVPGAPVVAELELDAVRQQPVPVAQAVPEFPSTRRDLAVVVDERIGAARLLDVVRRAAGPWLADLRLFDVWRGEGLPDGCKSVALGLIFQDKTRTLVDSDVDACVERVTDALAAELGAKIRG